MTEPDLVFHRTVLAELIAEAHAAGVEEGRAAANDRVEALLKHVHSFDHLRRPGACRRCNALRHGLPDTPEGWREAEARFPSEGTT